MQALIHSFTRTLYQSVCRSLFEKDKLIFSFLLTARLMQSTGDLCREEFDYFLIGSREMNASRPMPAEMEDESEGGAWLTNKQWMDILGLDDLWNKVPCLSGFSKLFEERLEEFHHLSLSKNPSAELDRMFPVHSQGSMQSGLTSMQRLVLLRILRPDKVIGGISELVSTVMGREYTRPPAFNLQPVFELSTCSTPPAPAWPTCWRALSTADALPISERPPARRLSARRPRLFTHLPRRGASWLKRMDMPSETHVAWA
jgi:dynein heavy chain